MIDPARLKRVEVVNGIPKQVETRSTSKTMILVGVTFMPELIGMTKASISLYQITNGLQHILPRI